MCETDIRCKSASRAFCFAGNDGCREACRNNADGVDKCVSAFWDVDDGVMCRTDPYSICVSGTCVEQPASWAWSLGEWSLCQGPDAARRNCSTTGVGERSRSFYCRDNLGTISPGARCEATAPVPEGCSEATSTCVAGCGITTCLGYTWASTNWTECSDDCGGGERRRDNRCYERSNPTVGVDPALCPSPAPATVESCNLQACPTDWNRDGAFSDCSAP